MYTKLHLFDPALFPYARVCFVDGDHAFLALGDEARQVELIADAVRTYAR